MLFSLRRLAAGFAALMLGAQIAAAAEIKVYSTIGVKSVLEELAPKFEKATGNKLNITWGLISGFTKKAQEGDVPDVLIVSRAGIDSLTKDGKIAAGSGATLGSSIFAVGVKQGAPKPDISTVDAFKKTLLAARAIGYTDPAAGGASGVYFAKVLDKLGIAGEIKPKSKFPPPAGFVGNLLVSGEVDLAVQSKPELTTTPGVDVVGPFPGDLANTTVFAVGVGAVAKDAAASNALVKFLTSPEALTVFKAKGFDPA
jgi:molybdate transport system substrate-binding protein